MNHSNNKVQVKLDENAHAVIVRGGIKVEFNANGGIDVYGNGPVTLHTPANDTQPPANDDTKPGDRMPDGTVYAGISPDTGKPFYVDAADAPGFYTFYQARDYAESYGKRVPGKDELNVLFNNKTAIAGFNETGSVNAGWYWSSSRGYGNAGLAQRFSDGSQGNFKRRIRSSLRLVRD